MWKQWFHQHAKERDDLPFFFRQCSSNPLDAERDFGIVSRYLMNGIRHLGAESVRAQRKSKNPHPALVSFGLAGDELHFPPHLFTKTFDILKQGRIL